MSLDDRDWYRDEMKRRAASQRPKPPAIHPALRHLHTEPGTPRWVIALAWIGIGALLYIAFTFIHHFTH